MTRPKDCCSTDLPGATKTERAGSASSEQDRTDTGTVRRPLSCAQCGNDPNALVRAFKAGMQAAAFDTYAENIAAAELRAELDAQWHDRVRRYGDTPPPTAADRVAYQDAVRRMGYKS